MQTFQNIEIERGAPPRRPSKAAKRPVQLEMKAIVEAPERKPGRGGKRKGAGRKRAPGARKSVPHRVRLRHVGRHPVHVTLRGRKGLPSFRAQVIYAMFREVLHRQRAKRYAGAFKVIEFSIQGDHVHLIVEATGKEEAHDWLRAGVSGLKIAFAKRLNAILGRRGKVWGDRWHGHELTAPREVRNAIVYVFRNLAKHGTRMVGDGVLDAMSSATRFTWWTRPMRWPFPEPPWPDSSPSTWLLGTGWRTRGGGPIDPNEVKRGG